MRDGIYESCAAVWVVFDGPEDDSAVLGVCDSLEAVAELVNSSMDYALSGIALHLRFSDTLAISARYGMEDEPRNWHANKFPILTP